MGAHVRVKDRAVDRLAELGLDVSMVERIVRRADAEAGTCTELDPPILEGMTRWAKTSRFLREELIPRGWTYDNPRNLARTIDPSGEYAIIAATGDEMTGFAAATPTTKYRKGDATIKAVETNDQLAFDFGDFLSPGELTPEDDALLTWVLLFYADEHEFRTELSLPNRIEDGHITSWAERLILPPFPRALDVLFGDHEIGAGQHVVVEVSRR
jgi:hypothetical protein